MSEINNHVGVVAITPEGNESITYYFCIVDLPISTAAGGKVNFQEPTYDSTTKTLNYTYDNYTAGDLENLSTYKMPIYLKQEIAGEEVLIEKVIVNGSINGESQPPKGNSGTIKTSQLDIFPENDIEDASFGLPLYEIRYTFLISRTFPEQFFLIVFIKTYKGCKKLLHVELDPNNLSTLVCYPNMDNITSQEYIVAAHMAKTVHNQYTKAEVNVNDTILSSIDITYPNATVA